ncbi:unnamed protein product [Vitrella brassicaformis CCMP3155]|uniref:Uncharacterized protein n=1 Tax=Vitrella brassicaformis (strain CCMP3155) TaxID=1169540 RepID=A0A0G4GI61_VITBC|nr:unnamed protein product [Vitrella brassicaformis CCMP3155]|eukprot:CEM29270.1 unnamed protein product [Vitrella brassicaformis CCMP3155]
MQKEIDALPEENRKLKEALDIWAGGQQGESAQQLGAGMLIQQQGGWPEQQPTGESAPAPPAAAVDGQDEGLDKPEGGEDLNSDEGKDEGEGIPDEPPITPPPATPPVGRPRLLTAAPAAVHHVPIGPPPPLIPPPVIGPHPCHLRFLPRHIAPPQLKTTAPVARPVLGGVPHPLVGPPLIGPPAHSLARMAPRQVWLPPPPQPPARVPLAHMAPHPARLPLPAREARAGRRSKCCAR